MFVARTTVDVVLIGHHFEISNSFVRGLVIGAGKFALYRYPASTVVEKMASKFVAGPPLERALTSGSNDALVLH